MNSSDAFVLVGILKLHWKVCDRSCQSIIQLTPRECRFPLLALWRFLDLCASRPALFASVLPTEVALNQHLPFDSSGSQMQQQRRIESNRIIQSEHHRHDFMPSRLLAALALIIFEVGNTPVFGF